MIFRILKIQWNYFIRTSMNISLLQKRSKIMTPIKEICSVAMYVFICLRATCSSQFKITFQILSSVLINKVDMTRLGFGIA